MQGVCVSILHTCVCEIPSVHRDGELRAGGIWTPLEPATAATRHCGSLKAKDCSQFLGEASLCVCACVGKGNLSIRAWNRVAGCRQTPCPGTKNLPNSKGPAIKTEIRIFHWCFVHIHFAVVGFALNKQRNLMWLKHLA